MYGNKEIVVQASYNAKRSLTEVRVGKTRIVRRGNILKDKAQICPIPLFYDQEGWKFRVDFDQESKFYTLEVNDIAFVALPYQASITPIGPQLLEKESIIVLNGKAIDFDQFSPEILMGLIEEAIGDEATYSLALDAYDSDVLKRTLRDLPP